VVTHQACCLLPFSLPRPCSRDQARPTALPQPSLAVCGHTTLLLYQQDSIFRL